jgi:hypothetical protein
MMSLIRLTQLVGTLLMMTTICRFLFEITFVFILFLRILHLLLSNSSFAFFKHLFLVLKIALATNKISWLVFLNYVCIFVTLPLVLLLSSVPLPHPFFSHTLQATMSAKRTSSYVHSTDMVLRSTKSRARNSDEDVLKDPLAVLRRASAFLTSCYPTQQEQPDWTCLPALVLYKIASMVHHNSFTVLAMHQVCRAWHAGLGPIQKPCTWHMRSFIFGARVSYIAWALECCWLDPAGALTLAARLGDISFLHALKQHLDHVMHPVELDGKCIARALLQTAGVKLPDPMTSMDAASHAMHTHAEKERFMRINAMSAPSAAAPAVAVAVAPAVAVAVAPAVAAVAVAPASAVVPRVPRAIPAGHTSPQQRKMDCRQWVSLRGRLEEALHAACNADKPAVVEFLHKWLGLTTDQARSRNNFALRLASVYQRKLIVYYLFNEVGLTLDDLRSNENYALRMVCDAGDLELVTFFINMGLSSDDVRVHDNEALSAACVKGHTDVVDYLISECRLLTAADARSRDYYPLRAACWRGHLSIMRRLISMGLTVADLAARDFLVTMALRYNHTDVLRYLVHECNTPIPPLLKFQVRQHLALVGGQAAN